MKINTGQFEPEKGGQVEADLPGQVEPEFSGQVKTDCMVNAFGKKVVKSTGLSNKYAFLNTRATFHFQIKNRIKYF